MSELKDFIDDWKIDLKNKSATHKSGLTIAYEARNDDGSLRLAYTGMMSWLKLAYSVTHDTKKIDEMRENLSNQFVEIYKQKMQIQPQIIQQKSLER
ncbi:MAG: hypothetical protein Q4D80_06915 [Pseudomonadota bacterium]|nr:hypothetical protein [Pseudomonadota bacterium]